jgi:hypothetical protein
MERVARLPRLRLRIDQASSAGPEFGGVGGQADDSQPGPGLQVGTHRMADMPVEDVPDLPRWGLPSRRYAVSIKAMWSASVKDASAPAQQRSRCRR